MAPEDGAGDLLAYQLSLTDDHSCWRQIHPVHLADDFFKYEAFNPNGAESYQLSVGHSSKMSAFDCFVDYTLFVRMRSAGVAQFAVKVLGDANQEFGVSAALWDDSMLPLCREWHCYVDFAPIPSRALRKNFAQKLWLAAKAAGWAYRVVEPA